MNELNNKQQLTTLPPPKLPNDSIRNDLKVLLVSKLPLINKISFFISSMMFDLRLDHFSTCVHDVSQYQLVDLLCNNYSLTLAHTHEGCNIDERESAEVELLFNCTIDPLTDIEKHRAGAEVVRS